MKRVILPILLLFATANAQYDWGTLLRSSNSAAWYGESARIAIADDILANQLANGGWRKDNATTSGEWAKATIDNDATTSHIRFLARVYKATNTARFRQGCERGIDLLINGQYANGGWPQIFGASSGTYHAHITFNDGAMVKVLDIMREVSERTGDFNFIDNTRAGNAKAAMDRGVECILNTQIVFNNGRVTAWCQQHNSVTLAPAAGRAYEVPSVSGSESVGIVNFLKRYQTSLGSGARRDVAIAINNAITWLDEVRIPGIRVENITTNGQPDRRVVSDPNSTLWARFYELNTGYPIFVGRDGVIRYSLAEIEQERRAGYAYYGNWPRDLINAGLVQVPDSPPPPPPPPPADPFVKLAGGEFIDTLVLYDPGRQAGWSVQADLRSGAAAFGDRDHTVTSVPEIMQGAEWIRPAMDSRTGTARPDTLILFNMRRDGTVYIAYENRVTTKPSWLAARGFVLIDDEAAVLTVTESNNTVRTFDIYAKTFAQGETVITGINSASGLSSAMMYLVAVTDREEDGGDDGGDDGGGDGDGNGDDNDDDGDDTSIRGGSSLNNRFAGPAVTLRGRTLTVNVSSRDNSDLQIRVIDVRGRVRETFTSSANNRRFSLTNISAGRYFVEVRGADVWHTMAVIVR